MAKTKTQEEMQQVVNEYRHLVPTKSQSEFDKWDLKKQYTKVLLYKSKANKLNISSIVKSITDKNPSQSDIEKIITQLQDWTNSSTQRRIEEIDKQMESLAKEKAKLTGK